MKNELRNHAEEIFKAGVERVNPANLLSRVLSVANNHLKIKTDTEEFSVDLSVFNKIKIIAIGKAASSMAFSLNDILGKSITDGLIISKEQSTKALPVLYKTLISTHPIPDHKSEEAGKKLLDFCKNCTNEELVIGLISGGASSLVEVPGDGLSLADLQNATELLLKSGATIHEMNCIRKHLSKIKGGHLSQAIFPAISLNFILSDVIGDDLSVIGSGLTAPDDTTYADALEIVKKYKLTSKFPVAVVDYLEKGNKGEILETIKSGDSRMMNTKNVLVGSNKTALKGARDKAQELGYETIILSDKIQGEARDVALKFYSFSRQVDSGALMKLPACIIAGGETTVTVTGSGLGGRNQEMALAYLTLMDEESDLTTKQIFLSASTDGGDGPTDVAGAFADYSLMKNAQDAGIDPEDYLDRNDSYHFFKKVGGHLITGPTQTNVCDLQILIII